jgi:ATP-dependent protease ClpP protease subunit
MKILVLVLSLFLVIGVSVAYEGAGWDVPKAEKEKVETACPVTRVTDNSYCNSCHILIRDGDKVRYGVKEISPYNQYDPIDGRLYYHLEQINADGVANFFKYAARHPELGKHVVIEVESFGGSVFEAWRIKSYFVQFEKMGYTIETRTYGYALSAGFIVFVSGTKGYRVCDANAEFMMHELWSIEWPKVATPSSKEEEAKVYRHLQDNINGWIASRGNMSKEELDKLIEFRDHWLVGEEMVALGFADKFIGE